MKKKRKRKRKAPISQSAIQGYSVSSPARLRTFLLGVVTCFLSAPEPFPLTEMRSGSRPWVSRQKPQLHSMETNSQSRREDAVPTGSERSHGDTLVSLVARGRGVGSFDGSPLL